MKTAEEVKALSVHLLNMLYSSALCHEFRVPVEVYYPHLKNEYSRIIKYPIDLGSLLLSTIKGYVDARALRAGLHLLFSNCICFNGGSQPILDSVAAHCDEFAGGLFEELIGIPYRNYPLINGFQYDRRLYKRRLRLVDVKDIKLNVPELSYIAKKLNYLSKKIKPGTISDQTYHAIINACRNADASRELRESRPNISDHPPVTLYNLFHEMVATEFIVNPGGDYEVHSLYKLPSILCFMHLDYFRIISSRSNAKNNTLSINLQDGECDENTAIKLKLQVRSTDTLELFLQIDDILGELLTHIHERMLRGSPSSSVWARPYGFVWAQPSKTPWWPCMILAGGSETTISPSMSRANLSRIPAPLLMHLNKVKPSNRAQKTGPQDSNIIEIPPNYYLVEFFSTHDFGWVKAESVQVFPLDGKLPVNGKGGSIDSIKSASDAMYQMLTEEFSYGFPGRKVCISSPYDYVEDVIPPNIEQLEQMFQVCTDAEKHSAILSLLPKLDPILGSCTVKLDELLSNLMVESALNATLKLDRRKSGDSLTLLKGGAGNGKEKTSQTRNPRKRRNDDINIAALEKAETFDPDIYQSVRDSLPIKRRCIIVTRQFVRWADAVRSEAIVDSPDTKDGAVDGADINEGRHDLSLDITGESHKGPGPGRKSSNARKTTFALKFGGSLSNPTGDTAIHSTRVDKMAPIFYREHFDSVTRKEWLKREIALLKASITTLSALVEKKQ